MLPFDNVCLCLCSEHCTNMFFHTFFFVGICVCAQSTKRGETVDEKIRKLDATLSRYRERIKKTRPGPAREAIKARAVRVLKQKRMYCVLSPLILFLFFSPQSTSMKAQKPVVASILLHQFALKNGNRRKHFCQMGRLFPVSTPSVQMRLGICDGSFC